MEPKDRITELEAALAARDAEIQARDGDIARLEAALAARDADIQARDAVVAALQAQVAKQAEQIAELMRRLGEDSGNSNKPPSSDPPANRAERRARKSGKGKRARGAQPGHKGSSRALVDAALVDTVVDLYPEACESCWQSLPELADDTAKRYQQVELLPSGRHITEWQRHAVTCPHCGTRTRATYDSHVIPSSAFGPRLVAVVVLLTGAYHLSRRNAAELLRELFGVEVSLGSVSNMEARASAAMKAPVDKTWEHVRQAQVKHTDGTSWYQSGVLKSLWTIATTAATVFTILDDGRGETLKAMFDKLVGVLISDRATALKFWAMNLRQVCWAHLLRKFISFSERDGPAGTMGGELVDYVGLIFAYWNELKDGKLTRAQFRERMAPVRAQVEAVLERAAAAKFAGVSGSCADMLDHRAALWTFVDVVGIEPTNNHAEQALRAFVLWRKRSFGTQSARGNHFAARVMTVVETARKQRKNVLEFLTACCTAQLSGQSPPSLLAS